MHPLSQTIRLDTWKEYTRPHYGTHTMVLTVNDILFFFQEHNVVLVHDRVTRQTQRLWGLTDNDIQNITDYLNRNLQEGEPRISKLAPTVVFSLPLEEWWRKSIFPSGHSGVTGKAPSLSEYLGLFEMHTGQSLPGNRFLKVTENLLKDKYPFGGNPTPTPTPPAPTPTSQEGLLGGTTNITPLAPFATLRDTTSTSSG